MAALTFSYAKFDSIDTDSSDDDDGEAPPVAPAPHRVGQVPHPAAWAAACKTQTEAREWFVDAHRVRLSDARVDAATPRAKTVEFLVWCKLATAAGALPNGWNWQRLLAAAPPRLARPLTRDAAVAAWGAESAFSRLTGGRDFRFVALRIQGAVGAEPSADEAQIREQCGDAFWDAAFMRSEDAVDALGEGAAG